MKQHVAAGDPATAHAGRALLEAGGNAFDAAVAAMFTAMVAEPTLTSAGGGGHLMAQPVEESACCFDFFVDMPTGKPVGEMDFDGVWISFGAARQQFHIGRASVAVPGNIAGLLHVHQRLGHASRRDVLAPAIQAARDGVELSAQQGHIIGMLEPILTREPDSAAIFAPQGILLKAGEIFRMPCFADFLESLVTQGPNLFYKEIAGRITAPFNENGLLSESDLSGYTVHERIPRRTDFKGHTLLLNPPPAASGELLAHTLARLDAHDDIGPGELVDAFSETEAFRRPEPLSRGATTHVSVLDRYGNAASVTTTNGEGSGHVATGCGFLLNNMLGEEDLNPDGFHCHPPGVRLSTMMAPTIALCEGRPVLVIGSGGSNRIRSTLIQVLVNHLKNGMSLEAATRAPRVHLDGQTLHAEPGAATAGSWPVCQWPAQDVYFGGAHSVALGQAAGDPRRNGHAMIF